MKTPLPLIVIVIAAMLHTSEARADDWYLAGRLNTSFTEMENITHKGTIGTGAPFGNDIDGSIADEDIHDYPAGIGFAIGRRVGNWEVETELVWRFRTDWDIAATTYSINTITNVFTDVSTSTLLLNATRRFPFGDRWAWEVGAGIGLVVNDQDGEYIERAVPGISPETTFTEDATTTDFSWTVIVGVSRDFGKAWNWAARYRYVDLGELNVGPFDPRPGEVWADFAAQEFSLALKRRF